MKLLLRTRRSDRLCSHSAPTNLPGVRVGAGIVLGEEQLRVRQVGRLPRSYEKTEWTSPTAAECQWKSGQSSDDV